MRHRRFPSYSDEADYTTNAPSYYEDLARKTHLIKRLAEKIWEYDEELAKRFLEWDLQIETLPEVVRVMLNEWLADGTLKHIINVEIFNGKVDTADFVDLTNSFNDLVKHVDTLATKDELNQLSELFDELMDIVEVLASQEDLDDLKDELLLELDNLADDVDTIKADLVGRGVNLKSLGAVMDGVTDDYAILQNAINTYKHVYIPFGGKIAVSESIILPSGTSLIGEKMASRLADQACEIIYIGNTNRQRAVIQVGGNAVGDEPVIHGSNITLKNVKVDANNLAGFGVYGTFLTNETTIDRIYTQNTLEYGFYFARSWFASFTNLTSSKSWGNGLAFGMPLELQNGTVFNWTTQAPLEMNAITIENIRAHESGQFYAVTAPNTFTPNNPNMRRKGYGIGAGYGNGFRMSDIQAERGGGVGLYVLNDFQPMKTIERVYIEKSGENSGLNDTINAHIIIENRSTTGGSIEIRDVYCSYDGGIYHTGENRRVWLRNVYQPTFLKSLDGLINFDLFQIILKDNVYYRAGQSNTLEILGTREYVGIVNTQNTFEIPINTNEAGVTVYFMPVDGNTPAGSWAVKRGDGGENIARSFPALIPNQWTGNFFFAHGIESIVKAGGAGTGNNLVRMKVVSHKATYV